MAKYDPLRAELGRRGGQRVMMTFAEIEAMVGGLPPSAYEHQAWWANEQSGSHVHAQAWMQAGYRVGSFDLSARTVTFLKVR
ncbi:MAG: hypothetical protein KDA21_14740 [Phycisphaerales bacterium]|nr:hypothetical protein [Phycisphaerales bacterium]